MYGLWWTDKFWLDMFVIRRICVLKKCDLWLSDVNVCVRWQTDQKEKTTKSKSPGPLRACEFEMHIWCGGVILLRLSPLFTQFNLTLVPGWACHSSSAVYTSWHPTSGPPHLGPWWQTLHSLPARRWPRGTPLSSAAPGWSATAGSVWSLGLTQACRPNPGRQTLGDRGEKRGVFSLVIMNRGKFKEKKGYNKKHLGLLQLLNPV